MYHSILLKQISLIELYYVKGHGESAGYISIEVEQLTLVKLSVLVKFHREHLMNKYLGVTDPTSPIDQWKTVFLLKSMMTRG